MEDLKQIYDGGVYALALRIKNDFALMLEDGDNYVEADYADLFSPRNEGTFIRASKVAKLFAAVETFEDEYHSSEERYYPVAKESGLLVYPIKYPFRLDMPSTRELIKVIKEEL